jgi:hypothetical protein
MRHLTAMMLPGQPVRANVPKYLTKRDISLHAATTHYTLINGCNRRIFNDDRKIMANASIFPGNTANEIDSHGHQ